MKLLKHTLLMMIASSTLYLYGCSSPPSNFYLLSSLELHQANHLHAQPIYLGLGPIDIAQYLQQPQIITRLSDNQVNINEFHRWAEPLADGVKRIINQNLSLLVPSNHIANYPWPVKTRVDYRISMTIVRFDVQYNGESVLVARWKITNEDTTKTYLSRANRYSSYANINDYSSIVGSMNENITNLCRDIAEHLRQLAKFTR